MAESISISALVAAGQFDIKRIKAAIIEKPSAESSTELFYAMAGGRYRYFLNYGVAVFSGYSDEEIKSAVEWVLPFSRNALGAWIQDDYEIILEPGQPLTFDFEKLILGAVGAKEMRIIMFNLAQSVAIDHYNAIADRLLGDVRDFANQLETRGTLRINRRNMLRFIGRALNTQNDIATNIYIFDVPDLVWDDEFLDKLHAGLSRHFDLRMRNNELEYTLKIIENNLTVFSEISNQRRSTALEWIIIGLILFEVLDLVISKFI
jgi:required for meiotic nuclear division protein 1